MLPKSVATPQNCSYVPYRSQTDWQPEPQASGHVRYVGTRATHAISAVIAPVGPALQECAPTSARLKNMAAVAELVAGSRTLVGCENFSVLKNLTHALACEARRRNERFVALHTP